MILVYFSPVAYRSMAQRPQRMISFLCSVGVSRVIWVEPTLNRLPSFSDFARPTNWANTLEEADEPRVEVISVPHIPVEPLWGLRQSNNVFIRRALKSISQRIAGNSYVVGIGKPSRVALEFLNLASPKSVFYDRMDDFPAFYRGLSRRFMTRLDNRLIELADYVICSARKMKEKVDNDSGKFEYIANGLCDLNMPEELESRSVAGRLRLIYVGTIGRWFDWPKVVDLAKNRPEVDICLVGPVYARYSGILPDNISISPAVANSEIWPLLASADVGLIPFVDNALTASVDPIKYYEYRVLGLPVLTTRFGDMRERIDQETVFDWTDSSITSLLEQSNANKGRPLMIDREYAVENNWHSRFSASSTLADCFSAPSKRGHEVL